MWNALVFNDHEEEDDDVDEIMNIRWLIRKEPFFFAPIHLLMSRTLSWAAMDKVR